MGRANPPDSIKNQRIETAAQEQRANAEKQRKLAEDQRKEAEQARACTMIMGSGTPLLNIGK